MYQVGNHSLYVSSRIGYVLGFVFTVGFLAGINYALILVPAGCLSLFYGARKIKEECEQGKYDAPEHAFVMITGALFTPMMFVKTLLEQFKNKGAPQIQVEKIMKR